MEFRKIKLKKKNEILENYFENRNFWKIGIFENRNVKIEVLKIIFLMYENKKYKKINKKMVRSRWDSNLKI